MCNYNKRIISIVLVCILLESIMLFGLNDKSINGAKSNFCNKDLHIEDTNINYVKISHPTFEDEQEEIRNEIFYGELEELVILVQAEAGNQDELGKRYIADIVFNRLDDKDFPDSIHDVIYQMNPIQFATTTDGSLEKAGYTVTEETFQIVLDEYFNRTNSDIIYFRTERYHECGTPAFKYGDHYFSTK